MPVKDSTMVDDSRAESIFTLDNVQIDLPIAGVGPRALSALLDYSIVGLSEIAWLFGVISASAAIDLPGGWAVALWMLGAFLIDYGYFSLLEIAMGGRSPGKAAVGLRVVTRHGGRPGVAALLLRNLVRTIDLFIGVILIASDPLARRLGDRLGGTLVVRRQDGGRLADAIVERLPRGWNAREAALLESFLRRSSEIESQRARRLARRFLAWIERDDPDLLADVDARLARLDPIPALERAVGKRR
jgi:uncharacterized RDD family membrane protein YckC